MKKSLVSLLLAAVMVFSSIAAWGAEGEIKVMLNGNELEFDAAPVAVNGRTFVPLRAIAEALDADVEWENDTQKITITRDSTVTVLQIGNTIAYNSGKAETLDAAPFISQGRTLVPIRFISECFGMDVDWDGTANAVLITDSQDAMFKSPVIDFSSMEKPEDAKAVLESARLFFEQISLPKVVFAEDAALNKKIITDPKGYVTAVKEQAWASAEKQALNSYAQKQDKSFFVRPAEDVQNTLDSLAAGFCTDGDMNFSYEPLMLDENTLCILLCMSDIDAETVSAFIGITYTSDGNIRLFSLQRRPGENYVVCETTKDSCLEYSSCENDGDAFLNKVYDKLAEKKK